MKKLNAFQIKIILIGLMLLDHIWAAFPMLLPTWTHALTRGVGVMFGYFLVEGYFYTRNKTKYGIRLFSWAVFMQIGNMLINNLLASKSVAVHNNIFATLFVGFIVISIFDKSREMEGFKKIGSIILAILISVVGGLLTEGGPVVVPFILITYFFRGNMKKQIIGYVLLAVLMFLSAFNVYPTFNETFDMLMYNSDFLLILAIPTILMYNGERGMNNNFSKYLFYVFYPLHLWILAAISFIIK